MGINIAGNNDFTAPRGDVRLECGKIAVQRRLPGGVDHITFTAHRVAEDVISVGMVEVDIAAEQSATQAYCRLRIEGTCAARRAKRWLS